MSNLSQFLGGAPVPWVSGTTYAVGTIVTSPANNYQPYVRIVAGAGATDPSIAVANWRPLLGRAIKSIQRGVGTVASSASSGTVTVTSVDTAKSELIDLGNTFGSAGDDYYVTIVLTNATTITASRPSAPVGSTSFSWQLVEYY